MHATQFSHLLLLLLAASLGAARKKGKPPHPCHKVHVFGARNRGTLGPYGWGLQSAFVKDIVNATGATWDSLHYEVYGKPNAMDREYDTTVRLGVATAARQLAVFGARCPDTKIVLVGYGIGATIFNDALCGGGHELVDLNTTEPTIAQWNIKAVLLPGDHRFTPGQPFNAGTATVPSFDTRPPGQLSCGKYDDKIQLYCDKGDPCCSDGKTRCSTARFHKVNNGYHKRYGKQALEFVLKKLEE